MAYTLISESFQGNSMIPAKKGRPTCILVLGESKSGKTTFVRNLVSKFYETGLPYVINLDPACKEVPYPPNFDIRDIVKYEDVMTADGHNLDRSIIATLDFFFTGFHQVIKLIENDGEYHEYIIVDTPGQIEIFTKFDGGNIITQALTSRYTTIIVYMMDTVSNVHPATFMSNIGNASTIIYKAKLPFIMVMNKVDIMDHSYAMQWFRDIDAFQDALGFETCQYGNQSMVDLVTLFREFFRNLRSCGISAQTGEGIPIFFELLRNAEIRYNLIYKHHQIRHSESAVENQENNANSNQPSDELDQQDETKFVTAGPSDQLLDVHIESLDNSLDEKYVDADDNKDVIPKKQLEKRHIRQYVKQ